MESSRVPRGWRLVRSKRGNTAGFLEEFEKRALRAIDATHLFGIRITRTPSGDHEATFTTLLVGPKE